MTTAEEWWAVDWARDRLRVWVMGPDGAVHEELASGDGTETVSAEDYEGTLARLIAAHLADDAPTEILIAGSVALPGLWGEGGLRAVPCQPPSGGDLTPAQVSDDRLSVHLVGGITQAQPAGIMFADAVRVTGFLAQHSGFDGVLCLPGRHSRWVHVSAGEIVSFQDYLTGQLIDMTARSLGVQTNGAMPEDVFSQAVEDAISRPQGVAARLGSIEAALMQGHIEPAEARARITGAFIGMELAAARPYWLGQRVALVGAGQGYATALSAQGVMLEQADEAEVLRRGFTALRG